MEHRERRILFVSLPATLPCARAEEGEAFEVRKSRYPLFLPLLQPIPSDKAQQAVANLLCVMILPAYAVHAKQKQRDG
jgi:hypothetical protein